MKSSFLVFVTLTLTATASEPARELLDLQAAEAKWQQAHLTNYSYVLTTSGYMYQTEVKVQFKDGNCVAQERGEHRKWRPTSCDRNRVSDLFDSVRAVLRADPKGASVTYDPRYGYIEIAFFNAEPDLHDSDYSVSISAFKVRRR